MFDLFAKPCNGTLGFKMVRGVVFPEELVSERIIREMPLNDLLLVEGVDCLGSNSDGEELGSKGVVFPFAISEYFEMEWLE